MKKLVLALLVTFISVGCEKDSNEQSETLENTESVDTRNFMQCQNITVGINLGIISASATVYYCCIGGWCVIQPCSNCGFVSSGTYQELEDAGLVGVALEPLRYMRKNHYKNTILKKYPRLT